MSASGGSYLIFMLGGERYAVDLCQVAEVGEPPELWPIPCAPPCYVGAMNFHGAIVAVLELRRFLGLAGQAPLNKNIVLAPSVAGLSLLVEKVLRMVPADSVSLRDVEGGDEAERHIVLDDGEALVLDAAELARRASEQISGWGAPAAYTP